MIYLVIIVIGGLFNLTKVHRMLQSLSEEEAPYKMQGYISGFFMGAC